MQKFVKGGPFGFLKIQFVVKLKGDFLETLKNFQKSLIEPKNAKGDEHLVSSGFANA